MHTHKALPPVDMSTVQLFEVCECGAVKQVLNKYGKPVSDIWHLCELCVMPQFRHLLEGGRKNNYGWMNYPLIENHLSPSQMAA